MTGPKRHHYVPRFYLDRFASSGRVRVRRRDGNEFVTSTVNVAVESGFYAIESATGSNADEIERWFSEIEGQAAQSIRKIAESGEPPVPGSHDQLLLAGFLALQVSRTPEQRERLFFAVNVRRFASGREITVALVSEYLEQIHLGRTPSENERQAAFDFVAAGAQHERAQTNAEAVRVMVMTAQQVGPRLLERTWTVEVDRKGRLVTSDSPAVLWRNPSERDDFEGVGLQNAEEIRFPLDPHFQLVLSKRPRTPTARITSERVRSCNQDQADGCHRFVIGRPGESSLSTVRLRRRGPAVRFRSGPLYRNSPQGKVYEGDVLHLWTPQR